LCSGRNRALAVGMKKHLSDESIWGTVFHQVTLKIFVSVTLLSYCTPEGDH
jgi:hypothetical protein